MSDKLPAGREMQSRKPQRIFAYLVDANDRLVSVNSEWLSVAKENQAEDLRARTVVGQPLFRFVTDDETRLFYQMIIDRVRSKQRKIVIPFRCDGPTVRRFMELEISPGPEGQVQFEGRIVREETREPVSVFDSSVSRSDEYLVVCSWCKRVDVSGDWVEVESAVRQLKLFDLIHLPRITHGMCTDCSERIRNQMDDTL